VVVPDLSLEPSLVQCLSTGLSSLESLLGLLRDPSGEEEGVIDCLARWTLLSFLAEVKGKKI